MTEGQTDREVQRQRERNAKTKDRETERQGDTETEGQRGKWERKHRDTQRNTKAERKRNIMIYR